MKNRNVKVIDEHNIDRDANIMFALELEGSEYVVYWITRDEESNNVFVSKVLKNLDGTYNMLNIDDEDKKKEVADIVKTLISNSVSDQNDKLVGTTTTLSNGKVAKFTSVIFNKEQQINVTKTYITTVKKEVTKVAETYYDVVAEESNIESTLSATPVVEPTPVVFPELNNSVVTPEPVVVEPITVSQPQVLEPVVQPTPVVVEPVTVTPQPETVVTPTVVTTPVVETPAATIVMPQPAAVVPPVPTVSTPLEVATPVVSEPVAVVSQPETVVVPTVATPPVVETPAATVVMPQPTVIPPVAEPAAVVEPVAQPLVFNAAKETNLNAALGEVANSTTIPVENIEPVREFGVETPVTSTVASNSVPVVEPSVQSTVVNSNVTPATPTSPKAGFANSKFFMVVAIAFFLASCIFLGYEVYNYFQLIK